MIRRLFMKKIISIFIITIVLGISSAALAERPSVTIGLKTWFASWEQKLEFFDEYTGETEIASDQSDYGLMYGPVVNLRYEKFFASLSYLMGGGFSFEWEEFDYSDTSIDYSWDYDEEDDRTDLDVAIGYYIHPKISLFLGYKNIDIDVTETIEENETLSIDIWEDGSSSYSATIKGPAFGVSGNYPIENTNWILFGSLGYLSLEGESEGESLGDFTGPSIEIGGAYVLEAMPVSITAGYKYQSLKSDEREDIFSGLTFGANYTF